MQLQLIWQGSQTKIHLIMNECERHAQLISIRNPVPSVINLVGAQMHANSFRQGSQGKMKSMMHGCGRHLDSIRQAFEDYVVLRYSGFTCNWNHFDRGGNIKLNS